MQPNNLVTAFRAHQIARKTLGFVRRAILHDTCTRTVARLLTSYVRARAMERRAIARVSGGLT